MHATLRGKTACYTLVSVLVLGTGIGSGQYYWILGIGWLSWYRSNPTTNTLQCTQQLYQALDELVASVQDGYKPYLADSTPMLVTQFLYK